MKTLANGQRIFLQADVMLRNGNKESDVIDFIFEKSSLYAQAMDLTEELIGKRKSKKYASKIFNY